jgi:hypothetical protein
MLRKAREAGVAAWFDVCLGEQYQAHRGKCIMFIYLNKNMGGPVRPSELGRDEISI